MSLPLLALRTADLSTPTSQPLFLTMAFELPEGGDWQYFNDGDPIYRFNFRKIATGSHGYGAYKSTQTFDRPPAFAKTGDRKKHQLYLVYRTSADTFGWHIVASPYDFGEQIYKMARIDTEMGWPTPSVGSSQWISESLRAGSYGFWHTVGGGGPGKMDLS